MAAAPDVDFDITAEWIREGVSQFLSAILHLIIKMLTSIESMDFFLFILVPVRHFLMHIVPEFPRLYLPYTAVVML